MLLVSDVFEEVSRVMRGCDDDTVYNRISDATEILCNKADIDPLIGWVDITTGGSRAFTLPREVDTVLAVNFSGKPSFPRDRWADFHLNGRGIDTDQTSEYFWDDKGDWPIFVDPENPVQLVAVSSSDSDTAGEVWAFGYDENDRRIVSNIGGKAIDGWKVPLYSTITAPANDAPKFKRIVAIRKSVTKGFISLYGTDDTSTEKYGEYEPDETLPKYRRITLSRDVEWVRLQFRRKVFRVTRRSDRIPLHSRYALMLMVKALQKYDDDKIEEATAYEAQAVRLLMEKQLASNPPTGPSFQVSNATRLVSDRDRMM